MDQVLQPGELVVKRVRWKLDAQLLGLIIGRDNDVCPNWLVLWSTNIVNKTNFKWHIADSLTVVSSTNINELRDRCNLRT